MPRIFTRRQTVDASPADVWDFFSNPDNLARLTPPGTPFETVHLDASPIYEGQLIHHRVGIFPGIKTTWVTEITRVHPGRSFTDVQHVGPFAFWHHRHSFLPTGDDHTEVVDEVHYHVGFGPLGTLADHLFVHRQLTRLFDHRQQALPELLAPRPR